MERQDEEAMMFTLKNIHKGQFGWLETKTKHVNFDVFVLWRL
jgi:hypothetical protein